MKPSKRTLVRMLYARRRAWPSPLFVLWAPISQIRGRRFGQTWLEWNHVAGLFA